MVFKKFSMVEKNTPKLKVAILGASGRLGRILISLLRKENFEVYGLSRVNLDIDRFILDGKFDLPDVDIIVNTIAFTNVDLCEKYLDTAFKINSDFPRELAAFCHRNNIKLIQISTDYVFSGMSEGNYIESSTPNPICIYGKSKLLGEQYVLKDENNKNLVIRTAWLFDLHSVNFLTWLISELEKSEGEINVVSDQFGSPTSTTYLALQIIKLLDFNLSRIIHVTNIGNLSWYDFALQVAKIKNFPTNRINPVSSKELHRIASRPKNSSLISEVNKKYAAFTPLSCNDALLNLLK